MNRNRILIVAGFVLLAAGAAWLFLRMQREFVSPREAAMLRLTEESSTTPNLLFERGFPSGVAASLVLPGDDPAARAIAFFEDYRDLYGFSDPELSFVAARLIQNEGADTVVLSQQYRGVPVYGAQLSVGLAGSAFKSAVGMVLSGDVTLDVVPTLTAAEAAGVARTVASAADVLLARHPVLMVYDLALFTDVPSQPRLVYVVDLAVEGQPRAFVDAHTGEVVNINSSGEPAIDYTVLDNNGFNWAGNCTLTDALSTLAADENNRYPLSPAREAAAGLEVDLAASSLEATYDYMKGELFLDSYDNLGGKMKVIVHITVKDTVAMNTGCGLLFNPSGVTLDIIAHEVAHSIVVFSSNLEYQFESGAINESFADSMGAFIDGNWTVAEDIGAFRSLEDPPAFGHPDRFFDYRIMPSTIDANGVEIFEDAGGVHYNSGIGNKVTYLLTEGQDAFNNVVIVGLGEEDAQLLVYLNMITLPSNAGYKIYGFNLRYNIAPMFNDGQVICTVNNTLYATDLLDILDQNCDNLPDNQDKDYDNWNLSSDNCGEDYNPDQADMDNDGIGDVCDADIDGDGTPNDPIAIEYAFGGLDNCPLAPNADQADSDFDGIGDACDFLFNLPPAPDLDRDGIPDAGDNCPMDANPSQKNTNAEGDNEGDACDDDIDGDHLTNNFDNCDYEFNVNQEDADGDGFGDACDWFTIDPNDVDITNIEDGIGYALVPLCEPDETGYYSPDFVTALRVTGLNGAAAWLSSNRQLYLSQPTTTEGELMLFRPQAGEQYRLNLYDETAADGETRTLTVEYDCGTLDEIDFSGLTAALPDQVPTPDPSGLPQPYARLLQDANCRSNPGTAYDSIDVLEEGFEAAVNATVPDNAWLRVELPSFNTDCWLARSVVELVGTLDGVPVMMYPAGPTPTVDPDESADVPQCADGIDNDGDGQVDGTDRECSDASDEDEAN